MSELELSARYVNERIVESEPAAAARQHALELGLKPPSRAVCAHLAFTAATSGARSIIEIGTSSGLSTLALHRGAPNATITTIDAEPEHLASARQTLLAAGMRPSSLRLISGTPADVLARMSDAAYDLVLIGDDLAHIGSHLQHALRMARPGGTIIALNALNGGRVASPARRDVITAGMRALIEELDLHPDLVMSVLPLDGGVLQLTRLVAS